MRWSLLRWTGRTIQLQLRKAGCVGVYGVRRAGYSIKASRTKKYAGPDRADDARCIWVSGSSCNEFGICAARESLAHLARGMPSERGRPMRQHDCKCVLVLQSKREV